jgi:glucose dehydrogenase
MNTASAPRRVAGVIGPALLFAASAFVSVTGAVEPPAQPPPVTPADWPTYNHDPAGWRLNPAETTLGPANVGKLTEMWRFPAADSKEAIGVVHATPAVVNGEVYFGTATFPAFYKLGADGKQLWVHRSSARKAVLPPPAPAGRSASPSRWRSSAR